jgi:hypothetical protein
LRTIARLELTGEAGADVVVDGRARGRMPLGGAIRLPAGEHQVSVAKPGRVPFFRSVTLAADNVTRLRAELPELRVERRPPGTGPEHVPPKPGILRSPWFWAGSAVVIAGLATAAWAIWFRDRGGCVDEGVTFCPPRH